MLSRAEDDGGGGVITAAKGMEGRGEEEGEEPEEAEEAGKDGEDEGDDERVSACSASRGRFRCPL